MLCLGRLKAVAERGLVASDCKELSKERVSGLVCPLSAVNGAGTACFATSTFLDILGLCFWVLWIADANQKSKGRFHKREDPQTWDTKSSNSQLFLYHYKNYLMRTLDTSLVFIYPLALRTKNDLHTLNSTSSSFALLKKLVFKLDNRTE